MSVTEYNVDKKNKDIDQLLADLETKRVGDCYIFIGSGGSSKLQTAYEFAKALNCAKKSNIPACGACRSCKKIERSTHPDIILLDFEKQGEILGLKEEERAKQKEYRIDSIRVLLHTAYLTPLEGQKKVFIIEGAEYLSEEAANSLLKALEEAPSYLCWILLTANLQAVIPTIQSRSRKIYIAGAPTEENLAIQDVLNKAVEDVLSGACREPLSISEKVLSKEKGNKRILANDFLSLLSQKMALELRKAPTSIMADRTLRVLQAQGDLKRNLSPQIVLDELLLNL